MPTKKRPKPLYQRGKFALHRREGRANLEIVWYDDERKRERSVSAGTADLGTAKLELDRRYLEHAGGGLCPTCRRPWEHEGSLLLVAVFADYLLLSEAKAGYRATKHRLGHVTDFLMATDPTITCAAADLKWIGRFRDWMSKRKPKDGTPRYSLSLIEGCVMQAAAAINALSGERCQFKAEQMKSVARTPEHRASVTELASMFTYCLRPERFEKGLSDKALDWRLKERANLLSFIRMAVATWGRPDAIFEVTAAQWNSAAHVLDLNPPGRRQTKKYRPKVPIACQFVPLLDAMEGAWLPISVLNQPWTKMQRALNLPGAGQAGPKLIRRSMATLARRVMGEANWRQGEMMLGHVKASISDVYALPDPANLGLALAATESIIGDIVAIEPLAYRPVTAHVPKLSLVEGGINA